MSELASEPLTQGDRERRHRAREGRREALLTDLATGDLHAALASPALTSMNLLNEVSGRHPEAVSFAAGRPTEDFLELGDVSRRLAMFHRYLLERKGFTEARARSEVLQYGRTKGIVHELIARNLVVDEDIRVDPESIVVTVGAQEAMLLVLRALRAGPSDVVLAVTPTYVGLTGAAKLLDMPVIPVRDGPAGIDLEDLRAKVRGARAAGLRPRACYLVPDFANPSGISLDLPTRRALLDLAAAERLLLLEDNPYGMFHSGADRPPTLKALDEHRNVVYVGSFAKTVVPGARVGYVVADQTVRDGFLADELAKIKSMVTLNTSPIAQAVIGGALLEHDCSLAAATVREAGVYRRNLRLLLSGLRARFGPRGRASWNTPAGGFFVVLTVDFPADDDLLAHSASRHGVVWTPMHHFYDGSGGLHQLRLSCSALTPAQIDTGLDRLANLIAEQPPAR